MPAFPQARRLFAATALVAAILPCESRADVTATSMALGGEHSCALSADGAVTCWGYNASGELGDGTNLPKWVPVPVVGLSSGVAAIDAGSSHTCALTVGGGVKCWGSNQFYGALGNGTFDDSNTPVDVVGLGSGVTAIDAGSASNCALMAGGGVKCWGANSAGGLGDGTTIKRSSPVDVLGLGGPVTAIAMGWSHTCVLTPAGGVKCWGGNSSGQLGNNTTTNSLTPVDVVGLASGVAAIAAAEESTCALTTTGALKCWGRNRYGELGDGSDNTDTATWMRLAPVDVVGLASGVAQVSMGGNHTCARTTTGAAKCWGTNAYYGALGNNGSVYADTVSTVPVDVFGLSSGATAIFSSFRHNCVLTAGGVPRCWGSNENGQLGNGASRGPARTPQFGIPDYDLAAGISHNLLANRLGEVWAWGDNTAGKLGIGTTAATTVPVRVAGLTDIVAVAAGMGHSLALAKDGTVWAWGLNSDGQLGIGAVSPSTCTIPVQGTVGCARSPVQVTALSDVVAISAGWRHSLALKSDGTVWEWGNYNQGGIGGAGDGTATPEMVPGIGFGARISAGYMHSVALESTGQVYAWGRGERGELGPGSLGASTRTPTAAGFAVDIAAGGGFTLSRDGDGFLNVWGSNAYGTLGDPAEPTSDGFGGPGFRAARDIVPGVTNVSAFAAGFGFALVRKNDGTVWSWGFNNRGQLGNGGAAPDLCGTSENRPCVRTAANVAAHDGALRLVAGGAHALATRPGGDIARFGDNTIGQLASTGGGYGGVFDQLDYDPDFTLTPGGTFGSGGSVGTDSGSGGLNTGTLASGMQFAPQLAGTSSTVSPVTLTNLTVDDVTIFSISTTGPFTNSHNCGAVLGGNLACTISVSFAPSAAGPSAGTLQISSDLVDSPAISIPLSGLAVSVPGAPTAVSATAGASSAAVSFTPPASNGGSPITGYRVTSSPGGIVANGTASPITVNGLSNGTSYTFTVAAINAYGTGAASSPASNAVTPKGITNASVTSSPNPSVAGTTATFTATVNSASGTPAGTVVFKDGGVTIIGCAAAALAAGTALCETAALASGSHDITAEYAGSAAFLPSVSAQHLHTVVAASDRGPDFDADARRDLVWQNADGQAAVWLMNGLAASSATAILGPGTGFTRGADGRLRRRRQDRPPLAAHRRHHRDVAHERLHADRHRRVSWAPAPAGPRCSPRTSTATAAPTSCCSTPTAPSPPGS